MDGDRDPEAPTGSTAESIAEQAAELFSAKGFAGTSIREIAEAAGITKPTLYYYFGSKEGLVRHILQSATRSFVDSVDGAATSADLRLALLALARGHVAFADSHPATVNLICRLQHQPPGEAPACDLEGMQQEGLGRLSAVFEAAIGRGEIAARPPELLALSFLGTLLTHIVHRQRQRASARPPVEPTAQAIVDLFLQGARGACESPR